MKYTDLRTFKQQKYREWFRLEPPQRKAKRRPLNENDQIWKVLIRLDSARIQREIEQGRLIILGPRHYRILLND